MSQFSGRIAALPQSIATNAMVKLQRSLIHISGEDASHYLNGLLTVQPGLDSANTKPTVTQYCGLLNAKGRVIADMFLHRVQRDDPLNRHLLHRSNDESYILDVDSALSDKIVRLLQFYRLQSSVNIKVIDSLHTIASWDDLGEVQINVGGPAQSTRKTWVDCRVSELGLRHLCEDTDPLWLSAADSDVSLNDYRLRRYLFGIPEGPDEIIPEKSLPLEFNLDYMNGINFTKGCYVGQELTIRSHHHGTVRKRVVPITISSPGSQVDPDDPYVPLSLLGLGNGSEITCTALQSGEDSRSVSAGSIISCVGNVGLALMRLNKLGENLCVKGSDTEIDSHSTAWNVTAMSPFWWPAD